MFNTSILVGRVAVLWFLVGMINIFIIKGTHIGKVVFVIFESRGWGIHSFDLLVFPVAAIALIITVVWWKNFKNDGNVLVRIDDESK